MRLQRAFCTFNIQKISFKKVNAFAFLVKKCNNEASLTVYFWKIHERNPLLVVILVLESKVLY